MKSRKTVGFIYYCCAIAFYACTLLNIFNSETRTMGIVCLCIGSTFLCLGSSMRRRDKNGHDDEKDNDTEE